MTRPNARSVWTTVQRATSHRVRMAGTKASTPKLNTAKPTPKVEFKAEADRKILGVAIIGSETSRPSWRLLRLGGGTPWGEIGGPIVRKCWMRGDTFC